MKIGDFIKIKSYIKNKNLLKSWSNFNYSAVLYEL